MKLSLTVTKLTSLLALVPSAYAIADESTATNRDNKPSLRGNFGKLAQDIERKLVDPSTPCNTVIETQSLASIKATLGNLFASQSTEYGFDAAEPLAPAIIEAGKTLVEEKIPLLEHDVQFMKVSRKWQCPVEVPDGMM